MPQLCKTNTFSRRVTITRLDGTPYPPGTQIGVALTRDRPGARPIAAASLATMTQVPSTPDWIYELAPAQLINVPAAPTIIYAQYLVPDNPRYEAIDVVDRLPVD